MEHRRHNAPNTNEVDVVLVDQKCDKRDIEQRLQRIVETHRAYDALQYRLIFSYYQLQVRNKHFKY